jgi:sulfatase modifying factor 1
VCVMAAVSIASADTIQGIDMEFVTIGNAGNAADTGGTPGCGAVAYNYRIGKYEVTNAQWDAFTAAAGAPTNDGGYSFSSYWTGSQQPTNKVSWYEASQFCNYLTSGNKSKGAYLFSGNNANPGSFMGVNRDAAKSTYSTVYVIPTEDEWYKAAYYKPDDSSYSLYANGLNTIPAADNGWNYAGGAYSSPWNVGTGTQEQNGTFDMMGNVQEWNETLFYGSYRGYRGGAYYHNVSGLASSYWSHDAPYDDDENIGFRVASIVPEPCSLTLLFLGGLSLRYRKR